MADPAVSDGPAGADRRRLIVLAAAALAVEIVYCYVISAGTFVHFPRNLTFLDDLAEGFRHGHLHLIVEPPAALLAQANPFDPANGRLWYWDASLYGGHYYLYWGPVPALLLAAVKVAFRISTVVGDQHVVFWLTTLQLLAGTLLVERAGRLLFERPPLTLEVAAIVALGCANPTLYDLARPAVYEAAIVGGQAFLLLGMVFAIDGVVADRPRPARFAAAGASWIAAFGCRMSVGPAIALVVAVTLAGAVAGRSGRLRRLGVVTVALGAPLALGFGAFLLYNHLRFGAWLDFGHRHQLTWIDLHVGPRFIATNLYAYFRRPPIVNCRFPFAYAVQDLGARAFPPGYRFPENYFVYEPVAGILPMIPWSWLGPLAVVGAGRESWRARTFSPRSWAVTATAVAAAAGLVPDLVLGTATNRYLGDVVGSVALLGAFGAFTAAGWLRARRRLRRALSAVAVVLAVETAALGFALGIKGQYAHFEADNPPLYQKLVRALSVCRGPIPPEPK
ncbi:MAG TPA: hypothetical protein VHO06_20175 [Polyangia bacterium]|nr:hypothetical protein [Polyangia bacterium]